jgi:glycosyltransferase involved in cell wall biosynthesis
LWSNTNGLCDRPFTHNCIICGRGVYGLAKSSAAYYGVKTNKRKLKLVDKFITASSFVKQLNAKHLGLSSDDIVVIPNFYDPDIDRQTEEAAGLPEDFILFVGKLGPHKGVNVLIKSYRKLDTETKLLLIGISSPDYHYESGEGIVVIEDAPRNVLMQAMSRCRFAVFPSRWAEGFGLVAIEAMSQKKAVIASDIGGLKDIVAHEETGLVVPPNDSNKLAEAITYLLQKPERASEMGERGYERFMKNYTPDVVVPMFIDVYKSLI